MKLIEKQKLVFEEISNYIKNNLEPEYSFLNISKIFKLKSGYSIIKFKIRHNTCDHEFYISKYQLIDIKTRCPKCNGGVKYSIEDFRNKVFEQVGNEYSVLDYDQKTKKYLMQHNCDKCNNYRYYVQSQNFLGSKENHASNRCPKCYGHIKYTIDSLKSKVFELCGDEFIILSDTYINNSTKIDFQHNTDYCNHKFSMRPKDFLKGNRCPKCKASVGEKTIEKWFLENNIKYERQYSDERCKNKNNLKFDFRVYDKYDNSILLEYDGRLHFEPWDTSNESLEHLHQQQYNDNIKTNFCIENNITLYRITYKDNIEEKLKEYFNLNDYRK